MDLIRDCNSLFAAIRLADRFEALCGSDHVAGDTPKHLLVVDRENPDSGVAFSFFHRGDSFGLRGFGGNGVCRSR
jgi:hypothetical protein